MVLPRRSCKEDLTQRSGVLSTGQSLRMTTWISCAGSELWSVRNATGPDSGPFHSSMRILCTGQVHERGRLPLFTLRDASSISCQCGQQRWRCCRRLVNTIQGNRGTVWSVQSRTQTINLILLYFWKHYIYLVDCTVWPIKYLSNLVFAASRTVLSTYHLCIAPAHSLAPSDCLLATCVSFPYLVVAQRLTMLRSLVLQRMVKSKGDKRQRKRGVPTLAGENFLGEHRRRYAGGIRRHRPRRLIQAITVPVHCAISERLCSDVRSGGKSSRLVACGRFNYGLLTAL